MMKYLLLVLLLAGSVLAQEPAKKREAPPAPLPDAFVEPDSMSIGVIQARPDDVGFQQLLRTAWAALQERGATNSGGFLNMALGLMATGKQEDTLLTFLPIQLVRVDRLDKDNHPVPTLGISIAGWPGVQTLYYNSLLSAPDGKPYPTQRVGSTTVVLQKRNPDQKDEEVRALAKVKGSYASFPNVGVAQRIIPRLTGTNVTMPDGDLNDVLGTVDRTMDTYGAVLNKNGSLWKFLWWLNQRDCARIQQEVGPEKLATALGKIQYLTWQGDLVSDDRTDLQVRFQTDSEESGELVADVLKETKGILKKYGRAGDLQMTTAERQVLLTVSMVGYKKMLQDYIAGPRPAQAPPAAAPPANMPPPPPPPPPPGG